jgi:hypothetical protein
MRKNLLDEKTVEVGRLGVEHEIVRQLVRRL